MLRLRGRWFNRHALHQVLEAFLFKGGLGTLLCLPLLLDLVEKLSALGSPIIDKGLDVLLKTLNRLFHLLIPCLGALQTSLEVQELLIGPFILANNGAPLSLEGLVSALLRTDSLVLEQRVKRHGEFSHECCLLVIRLDEPVLIWAVFLELLLEELLLIVCNRLFV
jgi:hypothetical protein